MFVRDESLLDKTKEAIKGGLNVEAAWMDMAADRGNKNVAHLGDPCHPAVLRQNRTSKQDQQTSDHKPTSLTFR